MSTTPKPKPKLSYKAQSYPSSDKPFECTACQLYFRRLHDLKRHERLHTGERPYCCKNCQRTFARLDALKRHLSAESNVHCSEWTYQPGLALGGAVRGSQGKLHQRSISLPQENLSFDHNNNHNNHHPHHHFSHHNNNSGMVSSYSHHSSSVYHNDTERTPSTPTPQDHSSSSSSSSPMFHRHHLHDPASKYHHPTHPQQHPHLHPVTTSSPEPSSSEDDPPTRLMHDSPTTPVMRGTSAAMGPGYWPPRGGPIYGVDATNINHWSPAPAFSPKAQVHSRRMSSEGPLLTDMMMMVDIPPIQMSSGPRAPPTSAAGVAEQSLTFSPRSHPHHHHSTRSAHYPGSSRPSSLQSPFGGMVGSIHGGRPRRDSYPTSPSRSTTSPSLSPTMSPSPFTRPPSSMSSPTQVWSYSKAPEHFDTIMTKKSASSGQEFIGRPREHRQHSWADPSSSAEYQRRQTQVLVHYDEEDRDMGGKQRGFGREDERTRQRGMEYEESYGPLTKQPSLPAPSSSPSDMMVHESSPEHYAHAGREHALLPRLHDQSHPHHPEYQEPHYTEPYMQEQQQQQVQQQQYQQQHMHHPHHHHHPVQAQASSSSPPTQQLSQQLSASQQHPHHGHQERDHCCDAMLEIQKLRNELHWVRSLAESSGALVSSGSNSGH